MSKKIKHYYSILEKIGPLKVALVVFCVLAMFILVVEQPGNPATKALKKRSFFIPHMTVNTVSRIEISQLNKELPSKHLHQK